MRIWSIHPKYLDAKGLVALWRETLLAKHILMGKTKGYKNHPQLTRFKEEMNPVERIDQYLSEVYLEAERRGYNFNRDKVNWDFKPDKMSVSEGQMVFEREHLLSKLKIRDTVLYEKFKTVQILEPHTMFKVTPGPVAEWGKI